MKVGSHKTLRVIIIALATVICALAIGFYAFLHQSLKHIPSDPKTAESIRFFAIGDQGSGYFKQWRVSHAMEALAERQGGVDFIALLGDNFYSKTLTSVDSIEWLSRFELVYSGDYLSTTPFYAVLGNHDHGHANSDIPRADAPPDWPNPRIQIDYSRNHLGSNRWRMPDWYYSADFGQFQGKPLMRIVFIDTNLKHEYLVKQANYIREQFKAGNNAPIWKVVIGHHPVSTYGTHFSDRNEISSLILPAMQDAKVDVYISGHDHNQQVIARDDEPFYFVSGGGGAKLYPIKKQPADLIFSKSEYGFLGAAVDKDALQIGHYDTGGKAISAYQIRRNCTHGKATCLEALHHQS